MILAAAFSVFGGTLAEYKSAVGNARKSVDRFAAIASDGDFAESDIRAYQSDLREQLTKPDSALRRVTIDGTIIETDDRWLIEKFRRMDEAPTERLAVLREIDERFAAIELKIAELEGVEASARTKDEDKRKLAEILRRIEFQKPEPPKESWLDRIRKALDRWLNDNFPEMQVPQGSSEGMRSTSVVLQILLYAVIIGGIGFLLYKFAPFLASRLRRFEREDKEDRVILGERISLQEDAGTLFGEAERLAREGDLRGAVRKGYIALLCELSDRKLIGLAHHKTNRDYLRDVRKHGSLHQTMHGLTDTFERHWYGLEKVTDREWDEFRDGYRQTMETAKR